MRLSRNNTWAPLRMSSPLVPLFSRRQWSIEILKGPWVEATVTAMAFSFRLVSCKKRRPRALKFIPEAFETTLSGHGYAQMIPRWRGSGYFVKLIFLNLPTPDLAVARVAARVAQGGHNVPESVIRRRFDRSSRNFRELYSALVNRWEWYDNSAITPRLMSAGDNR